MNFGAVRGCEVRVGIVEESEFRMVIWSRGWSDRGCKGKFEME